MTTHRSSVGWRRPAPRPAFALGFLAGVCVFLPAVTLALLFPLAEQLLPWLAPGGVLLRPLSSAMAGWSGGVNVLFGSLANGLVVGLILAAAALVLSWRR